MRKLIVKGKEITSVTVLAGADTVEQYATSELEKYLEKMGISKGDGITIKVQKDPAMVRDSYKISICECGGILIQGGGRGVVNGVYGFLEKYAGTRFFMPGLETLGEGDIVVEEGDEYIPVFEFRQLDWQCAKDADWCLKQGINYRADMSFPKEAGGGHVFGTPIAHTMETLLGTPRLEQPCLSDPKVLEQAIASVRKILAENPDVTIISVSQNDNRNYCTCEKCAAIDAEEGSHMGTLLRFVNAIAADVAEDYPNVVIDTLAYEYTRKPPAITKALPNVCIRLCAIECCYSHPLDDASCLVNKKFVEDIEEWYKICKRLYIWDYTTDYVYYIPTFPNLGVLRENMRFYAEHGAKGMYPEGNHNSPYSGEFGELRCYMLARLMRDPYMSEPEYYRQMDEFLEAYYGKGWYYIRAYIDYTCAQAAGRHISIWKLPFAMIPKDRYEAMEETFENWWDKAEELAGDRLEYVKRSRLQWRYIRLMMHPNEEDGRKLYEDVEAAQVLWSEGQVMQEVIDFSKAPDQWYIKPDWVLEREV